MKWQHPILLFVGLCWAAWGFLYRPFPLLGEHGWLDLVAFHTLRFFTNGILNLVFHCISLCSGP